MARLVRFRVIEGIAVVTLDAPPVNALSLNLRRGLWETLARIEEQSDIKGAVLMASGAMFSAGLDIRELDGEQSQPSLSQLCTKIEDCSKPIAAAISGQALGGGTELILACHYRLGGPDARVRALQLMISTQSVDSGSAHRTGLFDGIVQGDLASGGVAFVQNVLEGGEGLIRTRDKRKHFADGPGYSAAIAKAKTALAKNKLFAPHRIIDCVEAAWLLPFDAGLIFEQDAFARCLDNPQSTALRHVFMAERKIDAALVKRSGNAFNPVEPIGKSVVQRLRSTMEAAAKHMVRNGADQNEIDEAMVAYGLRKGPFGGKTAGLANPGLARQIVAALMVEGAACVEQGAVQRPSDIDALAVHGIGFPRRHGGPMRSAQTGGLIALRKDMRVWAADSEIWAVPDLLDQAIKDAAGFDAWT